MSLLRAGTRQAKLLLLLHLQRADAVPKRRVTSRPGRRWGHTDGDHSAEVTRQRKGAAKRTGVASNRWKRSHVPESRLSCVHRRGRVAERVGDSPTERSVRDLIAMTEQLLKRPVKSRQQQGRDGIKR